MPETLIPWPDLIAEARRLLDSLGEGHISESAYDTAWVARIRNPSKPDQPQFPDSYDWLLSHQHADGSWGAHLPFAHDRLICTLAALITLSDSSYRKGESEQAARRSIVYLNRGGTSLKDDPAETVGFELVLPELVRQAKALQIQLPYEDWAFVEGIRADKLARIPPIALYGGTTTLTTSLEYLGDRVALSLVGRCQASNGSFGASPAATAYVYMRQPDGSASNFLQQALASPGDGGVAFLHPFRMYDLAWVLRALLPFKDELSSYSSAVDSLFSYWTSQGMHDLKAGIVPDCDSTAVAAEVLQATGRRVDSSILELFEADDFFYTYAFERNQSVTTNAHVLSAVRDLASSPSHRRIIVKLTHYLGRSRTDATWQDKWHVSPFYATAEVIRSLVGLANELVRPAIEWILASQHTGGGWGFEDGTPEETALVIEALTVAGDNDPSIRGLVREPLERGASFLVAHLNDSPAPLWIGKALYAPHDIVRAIELGSLGRLSRATWASDA